MGTQALHKGVASTGAKTDALFALAAAAQKLLCK
jgi:hypothetical protein